MLRVEHLYKSYSSVSGKVVAALQDINLYVKKGEFVSIIGPSGCGKSTLFNLISGLELPTDGKITMNGKNILGVKGHAAYMMQKDLLLPWRTVLENCVLGLEIQWTSCEKRTAQKKAREKAETFLKEFNLDTCMNSYPAVLSGGMRQRIAFIRTILAEKEILLLDEPFGALDAYTKREMQEWLLNVWEKYRPTILFITHDIEEALFLSERVYVFSRSPASVKMELEVSLGHQRTRQILTEDSFIVLKRKLLDSLFDKD